MLDNAARGLSFSVRQPVLVKERHRHAGVIVGVLVKMIDSIVVRRKLRAGQAGDGVVGCAANRRGIMRVPS